LRYLYVMPIITNHLAMHINTCHVSG
jgi:hypothetical protein